MLLSSSFHFFTNFQPFYFHFLLLLVFTIYCLLISTSSRHGQQMWNLLLEARTYLTHTECLMEKNQTKQNKKTSITASFLKLKWVFSSLEKKVWRTRKYEPSSASPNLPVSWSHSRPKQSSPHPGPRKGHLLDTGIASIPEPVGNFHARNMTAKARETEGPQLHPRCFARALARPCWMKKDVPCFTFEKTSELALTYVVACCPNNIEY